MFELLKEYWGRLAIVVAIAGALVAVGRHMNEIDEIRGVPRRLSEAEQKLTDDLLAIPGKVKGLEKKLDVTVPQQLQSHSKELATISTQIATTQCLLLSRVAELEHKLLANTLQKEISALDEEAERLMEIDGDLTPKQERRFEFLSKETRELNKEKKEHEEEMNRHRKILENRQCSS